MSGLVKAKEYKLKDSNVEKLGSEEDRRVKKSSAVKEPAWKGMDNLIGTKIWRIEKFQVKDWPEEKYGKFYSGDSYIILHGEKSSGSNEIMFDVHFWIGSESTQDEYGTVAYKTVELDTYLDDKAIQHREVQGLESEEFLEYFKGTLEINDGGIESGFRHVEREERGTMLVHFKKVPVEGTTKWAYEPVVMPLCKANLHSSDTVVVFSGSSVYQIKPKGIGHMHCYQALNKYWSDLKAENPKAEYKICERVEEFEEDQESNPVLKKDLEDSEFKSRLFRVSTDKAKLKSDLMMEVPRKDANSRPPFHNMSEDVYLLKTLKGVLVYVGAKASSDEKKKALFYADKLGGSKCPCTVRTEGQGRLTASWKTFFLALKDFPVNIPQEGTQHMKLDGPQDHRM